MTNTDKLGPWVRRFLLEHMVADRNLSKNTQRSYRDTLALFLPFVAKAQHKQVDQLVVEHRTILPATSRGGTELLCGHSQPKAGRRSRFGFLHWRAQPGAHRLVRPNPLDSVQEDRQTAYPLPRQTRNRCNAGCGKRRRSRNPARLRIVALSVQLWSTRQRSRQPDYRESGVAICLR